MIHMGLLSLAWRRKRHARAAGRSKLNPVTSQPLLRVEARLDEHVPKSHARTFRPPEIVHRILFDSAAKQLPISCSQSAAVHGTINQQLAVRIPRCASLPISDSGQKHALLLGLVLRDCVSLCF